MNSATRARRLPIAGSNSGKAGSTRCARRQAANHLPQPHRQQAKQPERVGQRHEAQPLGDAPAAGPFASDWDGAAARRESSGGTNRGFFRFVADLFHRHAKRLDQLAVLHARGAGRLAGAAVEARLEVPPHVAAQRQPGVGDGAHQIKFGRADCRFRCPFRCRSGRPRCRGHNECNPRSGDNRSSRPDDWRQWRSGPYASWHARSAGHRAAAANR